jgi:hypothetical protein
MEQLIQTIVIGAIVAGLGALVVANLRQGWLVWAILIWLFLPLIVMVPIFTLGALTSPASGTGLYALVFAVMLIGTIILLPWLITAGIGVAVGLAMRRKRLPEPPVPASANAEQPKPQTPSPSVAPPPFLPQSHLAENAPTPHFSQTSPDGSLRVDIEPVEWGNSQWVNTPRVLETATGRILCDLFGSDWEANTSFPHDRQVWLGLRRYRSPGHLFADFDLAANRYRIALRSLDKPEEEGPLGDISERLEFWWQRATALASANAPGRAPVPSPGPFAAWRTALVILIGALAAIAVLTYLSVTYDIDPPHVPAVPHIPRMPAG